MRRLPPFASRVLTPRPLRWFAAALLFVLAAMPDAARADCAAFGLTVLCQPPGTNGFDAGATNGYTVTVKKGWRGPEADRAFLRQIHVGACGPFSTCRWARPRWPPPSW